MGKKVSPNTLLYRIREGKLTSTGVFPYSFPEPYKASACLFQRDKATLEVKKLSDLIREVGATKLASHSAWTSDQVPAALTPPTNSSFEPNQPQQKKLLEKVLEMGQAWKGQMSNHHGTSLGLCRNPMRVCKKNVSNRPRLSVILFCDKFWLHRSRLFGC